MTEIIVGWATAVVSGALLVVALVEIRREGRDARRMLEAMIEDVRRRAE